MKWLGPIAAFFVCAGSMYMNLSRRALHAEFDAVHQELANHSNGQQTWDEKNRRPVKSVFFMEVPEWIRKSDAENHKPSPAREPSAVQSNPYAQ